jgi:hypothetical protein
LQPKRLSRSRRKEVRTAAEISLPGLLADPRPNFPNRKFFPLAKPKNKHKANDLCKQNHMLKESAQALPSCPRNRLKSDKF